MLCCAVRSYKITLCDIVSHTSAFKLNWVSDSFSEAMLREVRSLRMGLGPNGLSHVWVAAHAND